MIHATATSALASPKAWLTDPASKVSAHYLIGRAGELIQMVDDNDTAWHAGESEWGGVKGVNAFSIGIELVNSNDEKMEYPDAQMAVCADLVTAICLERKIKNQNVVGHKDIAPGRKTDPAGFDWIGFRARLASEGIL